MILTTPIAGFISRFTYYSLCCNTIVPPTASQNKKTQINAPNKLICKHCGESLLPQDAFCNNCQTINPRVRAMLNTQPKRPPLDYHPSLGRKVRRCPHCEANYSGSGLNKFTSCSPIIGCDYCHNYFIDDKLIEWSVAGRSNKTKLVIGSPITIICVLSLAFGYCTGYSSYWLYPLLVGLYLIYRILLFNTVHYEKIQKSNLRLKHNSDYPQTLIDMGYNKHMDKRYNPLMKTKPTSWLDFIKDVLTFN